MAWRMEQGPRNAGFLMRTPKASQPEARDITEFEIDLLPAAGVRITHIPTGLYRESSRYPVTTMNRDAAYDELIMELDTNPAL